MIAVAAVGARVDYALTLGPAAEADVQEAAEGEAEKAGEDCAEDTNHARVEYTFADARVRISYSNPRSPSARDRGHPPCLDTNLTIMLENCSVLLRG